MNTVSDIANKPSRVEFSPAAQLTIARALFPGEHVICLFSEVSDCSDSLLSAEAACIHNVAPKRRAEFSTGRQCARAALQQMGMTHFPLLPGKNREPIWPEHITGSLSHSHYIAGVCVALKTYHQAIGMDIEAIRPLKYDLSKHICTEEEQSWLTQNNRYTMNIRLILLFSLKEAIYKAYYQLGGVKLGFHDCTIIPDLETNIARLHFIRPQHSDLHTSLHFVVNDSHIFSSAVID